MLCVRHVKLDLFKSNGFFENVWYNVNSEIVSCHLIRILFTWQITIERSVKVQTCANSYNITFNFLFEYVQRKENGKKYAFHLRWIYVACIECDTIPILILNASEFLLLLLLSPLWLLYWTPFQTEFMSQNLIIALMMFSGDDNSFNFIVKSVYLWEHVC